MSSTFPLLGEPPALDLVNTLIRAGQPDEQDLLAVPGGLADWLSIELSHLDTAEQGRVPDPDPDRVRALRGDLTVLFAARLSGSVPPADAVARVNALAVHAAPQLRWTGARPRLARGGPGDEHPLLVTIAASAVELLPAPDGRVRACAHPRCTLLFADPSGRRRWCSTATCGNRARAARHYARRHPR